MRGLVIGDTHTPYHHPKTISFLTSLRRIIKPDYVVHIGDLGDQHAWSSHEKQPEAKGSKDEDEATLTFCRELYKVFPVVKACIGNHDLRLARKCVSAGVPRRLHKSIAEIYESPSGWDWQDSHVIDGIAFIHGEGYSGNRAAVKAALNNRLPTVIGHLHALAGVEYEAGPFGYIWGASTGCLIDPQAAAHSYGKKYPRKPMIGALGIYDGVPAFYPMN